MAKKKKVLITGITGQDGSYLAEFLLEQNYDVYGLKRRTAHESTGRIKHLLDQDAITLVDGDLTDSASISEAVRTILPDEIYNLGAQSFVQTSFTQPEVTADVTGLGVLRLLEAIRIFCPEAKFYQASSSEMFGACKPPQNENSPFHPRSPYGVSKMFAYWMTINYRERESGIFGCNGVLFNHESSRRGSEFVTQKIAQGVAAIKRGEQDKLYLGNLDAKRDWGHARDFVKAMWLMLQQDEPDDYVIATGEAHSVREFCEVAFSYVGLDYLNYVEISQEFFRPTEVDYLLGDPSKAKEKLGWIPETTFTELVEGMVDAALGPTIKKVPVILNKSAKEVS